MPRATLDFFAHQRAARRRTLLLLAWFGLALLAVVALVYLALVLPLVATGRAPASLWHPTLLLVVIVAVLGTTVTGCVYHAVTVGRGGPEALASSLGAAAVHGPAAGPDERRLLNVVEEMAIAAGLPVPRVFVLGQEEGINAFAAGSARGAAIVALTRGALARLSRDELQAVVAHEFSHLLNDDATLNARLMGMLGGLTIIDLFGREALRVAWSAGRSQWRAGVVLLPTGLVLAVAGFFGVLCGQLVRCGVSRQREYLADAAAAQLTRNPAALAAALIKIRDHGSALRSSRALEASHFFFANALGGTFERWLATHPSIDERIRRLDPAARRHRPREREEQAGTADAVLRSVGAPSPAHLARATELLATLPAVIGAAARDPEGAGALVSALALAPAGEARAAQLRGLVVRDPAAASRVDALAPEVDALPRAQRLVAVDLALASLDALPAPRLGELRAELAALAGADGKLTVFEWMLQRLVMRRMERRLSGRAAAPVRYRALAQVEVEALELLSIVAWAGTRDGAAAQAALTAGLRALGGGTEGWKLLPRDRLGTAAAESALRQLDRASPGVKQAILRACTASMAADARITGAEAELLRVIGASLGCPMPPLLPGPLSCGRVVAL